MPIINNSRNSKSFNFVHFFSKVESFPFPKFSINILFCFLVLYLGTSVGHVSNIRVDLNEVTSAV